MALPCRRKWCRNCWNSFETINQTRDSIGNRSTLGDDRVNSFAVKRSPETLAYGFLWVYFLWLGQNIYLGGPPLYFSSKKEKKDKREENSPSSQ
jgi:hypothetical protein